MYEIVNFSLGVKKKTGQEILRAIVSLKKFSYDLDIRDVFTVWSQELECGTI